MASPGSGATDDGDEVVTSRRAMMVAEGGAHERGAPPARALPRTGSAVVTASIWLLDMTDKKTG